MRLILSSKSKIPLPFRYAAEKLKTNTQNMHAFGHGDVRPYYEAFGNIVRGRLAEPVVCAALNRVGHCCRPDYSIFSSSTVGDAGDICGRRPSGLEMKLEIKQTKNYSHFATWDLSRGRTSAKANRLPTDLILVVSERTTDDFLDDLIGVPSLGKKPAQIGRLQELAPDGLTGWDDPRLHEIEFVDLPFRLAGWLPFDRFLNLPLLLSNPNGVTLDELPVGKSKVVHKGKNEGIIGWAKEDNVVCHEYNMEPIRNLQDLLKIVPDGTIFTPPPPVNWGCDLDLDSIIEVENDD